MAGTKGEEAIVEGNEEIGGRKRANEDKDAYPAKRAKVEGNEAAGTKRQSLTMACNKGEEGEGKELKEKVDRLRGLLKSDPTRLRDEDVEDVIRYLDVDDIIRLALKSRHANRWEWFDEWEYLEEEGPLVPSGGKVLRLLKLMVKSGIEKLKNVDLYILHKNLPKLPFAQLLLRAVGSSYSLVDGKDKAGENVTMSELCCLLPWKVFSHIMYHKTLLPQFKRDEEGEGGGGSKGGECGSDVEKKGAERCEICNGKGKHRGVYGYHCSFWDSVPSGLSVGPSHFICCRQCGWPLCLRNGFCCDSRMGKAVPRYLIRWQMN